MAKYICLALSGAGLVSVTAQGPITPDYQKEADNKTEK